MIVSSTVALRVDVPASGKSEKATFPNGQLVDGEDGGEGTSKGGDIEEAAEEVGRRKVDVASVTCCIAFRLLQV